MKKILIAFLLGIFINGSAQNADIELLDKINQGNSADDFSRFISNTVTPIAITTPIYFIARAVIQKDSVTRSKAIFFTSSIVITTLIVNTLKVTVQRERPFDTYSFIEQKTHVTGSSFPSGHTATAFQLATSLTISYPKWYVAAPAYLWASAVGYSRMELGVHYPSDVLAGAVIGTGSAILSKMLTKWVNKKGRR